MPELVEGFAGHDRVGILAVPIRVDRVERSEQQLFRVLRVVGPDETITVRFGCQVESSRLGTKREHCGCVTGSATETRAVRKCLVQRHVSGDRQTGIGFKTVNCTYDQIGIVNRQGRPGIAE